MARAHWLLIAAAALVGVAFGLAGYTFVYARGWSYLTNDARACANCHVMQEQYAGWLKSSHRSVAACNDCHTPPDLLGKYFTKVENGFRHSWAFTTGDFHEPIQIVPHDRAVTERVEKVGQVGSAQNETWFDTTGFATLPANTRRANPWYYDDLTGPDFKNLDAGLSKRFDLNRRFKMQVRLDAFNALNMMNWANPNVTIGNTAFGKTNAQAGGYFGRQLQYSVRLQF